MGRPVDALTLSDAWHADRERHEQAVRDRFGDVDAKIRAALLRLDA